MAHKYALIFPGQGAQHVGMGYALALAYPEAAEIYQRADAAFGSPLSALCFHGPEADLTATANLQPALFATSMAAYAVLEKHLLPICGPDALAGHSLGEFAALVAAGALGFEDALRLVRARGLAMQRAGEAAPGGMLALLGVKDPAAVNALCLDIEKQAGLVVQIANENCPGQVVVSGSLDALSVLERLCAERKLAALVSRLPVSVAAHSRLMEPALPDFLAALGSVKIGKPAIPVIGNVSAGTLRSAEDIREELEKQLTSRVRWMDTTRKMAADGISAVVEVGPGTVLTGLSRRTEPALQRYNFGDAPEELGVLVAGITGAG